MRYPLLIAFMAADVTVMMIGYIGCVTSRWGLKQMFLTTAISNSVGMLVSIVIAPDRFIAAVCTFEVAMSLWGWWNNGGGDDTKRRLRSMRRFVPVRRTAPETT